MSDGHNTTDGDRRGWNPDYWAGRPKINDEDEVVHPLHQAQASPNGDDEVLDDFKEITGYEVTEPERAELDDDTTEYTEDWAEISANRRAVCGWRCEECQFTLAGSPAIQVHHVNRDKLDNSKGNLQVLCLKCHGDKHGGGSGMGKRVPVEDRTKLAAWHKDSVARARDRLLMNVKIRD